MNAHDLPMVLFTVLSQMAVGTFVTLGVIYLYLRLRSDATSAEKVVAPVMYAVGPVMVLGLAASILHVNDVFNLFNVFRNWQSSWLSREIIFGIAFAAFGFAFAIMAWFKWGSFGFRQVLAVITAIFGVLLLVSEAMIYYSVEAVPAWNTWVVPFQFFATAVLLGVLAVGSAMMITTVIRARAAARADGAGESPPADDAPSGLIDRIRHRIREINSPTTDREWELTTGLLRSLAVVGAIVAMAILVVTTVYIGILSQGNATARASAEVLAGNTMWLRLVLVAATAILLGFAVYRLAATARLSAPRMLAAVVVFTMGVAMLGEILGRVLHYESMLRVGL